MVILFGFLAQTGVRHGTDTVMRETFAPKNAEIEFDYFTKELKHPNAMQITDYKDGNIVDNKRTYSIGGGTVLIDGIDLTEYRAIYRFSSFGEISKYCKKNKLCLWEYVVEEEGEQIVEFLNDVWQ